MKLCPYCGKELTEHALACKHCGEWLEDISEYLEKKGSIYAHADSIILPPNELPIEKNKSSKSRKPQCVFCNYTPNLNENEINGKEFICSECGKKNKITNGEIDEVLKNVPVGWGWILLTLYFVLAVQKYLFTLDDALQMIITFSSSVFFLLLIYFVIRRILLKERFEKKNCFGTIYNASLISGTISTIGVVLFIFVMHFAYPLTGLKSDKKETNIKLMYYKSKISTISDRQKEINNIISKPFYDKNDAVKNTVLLDDYINLNGEEKKYIDSIYQILGESDYYTSIRDNKKKIKEANILISKIIAYKIMSARNLKSYYLTGDNNALTSVRELNTEISDLSKEYSKNYMEIFLEE